MFTPTRCRAVKSALSLSFIWEVVKHNILDCSWCYLVLQKKRKLFLRAVDAVTFLVF